MIRIENIDISGWRHAIRGMRNPLNSWDKSDSDLNEYDEGFVGPADLDLMVRLRKSGTDHRKFMRMITVYADITAPLYWWKEFDTYKVGTVANSCSTMHKIHDRDLFMNDFSYEDLDEEGIELLKADINYINKNRACYLETENVIYWHRMIQKIGSNYNQKRTVMLNYEVLANMYAARHNHKLYEWKEFCKITEGFPYAKELIM